MIPEPTELVTVLHPNDVPDITNGKAGYLAQVDAAWGRGIKVPVEFLCDLNRLDPDEIVLGWQEGIQADSVEPGCNRTRSFWHGWRNGAMDKRHREKDAAQAELARRAYWWSMRDRWGRNVPDRYQDLERAFLRGEAV